MAGKEDSRWAYRLSNWVALGGWLHSLHDLRCLSGTHLLCQGCPGISRLLKAHEPPTGMATSLICKGNMLDPEAFRSRLRGLSVFHPTPFSPSAFSLLGDAVLAAH